MRNPPHLLCGLLFAGSIIAAKDALASGFAIRENSTADIAMAYAGSASKAEDVSTAFSNPAGLTYLKGFQADFGITAIHPSVEFKGSAVSSAGAVVGNNGHNGGRDGLLPHFFLKYDLTDRLKGGLAITAPFGNVVKYNGDFIGRYAPGGIETAAYTIDINPSFAYRVCNRLSIGAGVSAQWYQVVFSNAINQTALLGSPLPDGILRVKGDDWRVGYNVGILAEPWDGTRIGLTYRSKVDHKLEGTLEFRSLVGPLASAFVTQRASADLSLPASTTLSVTQAINPKLSLSWELQWTQWSTWKTGNILGSTGLLLPLVEGYRDSFMSSIGMAYRVKPALTLRAGFGFDGSPVQNGYRTVGVPDQDRYMIGLGFDYKLKDRLMIDVGYAHYFASKASLNNSTNAIDGFGTTTLRGTYDLALDVLSVGLRYKF